jgi:hypothetical protein
LPIFLGSGLTSPSLLCLSGTKAELIERIQARLPSSGRKEAPQASAAGAAPAQPPPLLQQLLEKVPEGDLAQARKDDLKEICGALGISKQGLRAQTQQRS